MITTTFDFPDFFVFASGSPTPPVDVKEYFFRTVVIEQGGHRSPQQPSDTVGAMPEEPFFIRDPRNYLEPFGDTSTPEPYPFPDPYTHTDDEQPDPFGIADDPHELTAPFLGHHPHSPNDDPFGPPLPSPYEQVIDSSFTAENMPNDVEIASALEHVIGELKTSAYEHDCNAVVGFSVAIINQGNFAVLTVQGNFATLT